MPLLVAVRAYLGGLDAFSVQGVGFKAHTRGVQ
jgi:hypothetical protein